MELNSSPKAKVWRIYVGESSSAVVASANGLTAFEAWQRCKLHGNPAFHQCSYQRVDEGV